MAERPWCWCCAVWGLSTPADVRYKDGDSYSHLCNSCDKSSPSACKKRHMAQALSAAKAVAR